jgi:hypothetical protein
MTPIAEANLFIHCQSVTRLGKEFPELCNGTIACYMAENQNCSSETIRILHDYTEIERALSCRTQYAL